jgi:hypothetical protein
MLFFCFTALANHSAKFCSTIFYCYYYFCKVPCNAGRSSAKSADQSVQIKLLYEKNLYVSLIVNNG